MTRLVVFNWKLNPRSVAQARLLAKLAASTGSASRKTSVVICPPFEYLFTLRSSVPFSSAKLAFGAQDCFWENLGPYTGEVSPCLLKQQGVGYVILGHSERREYLQETDALVAKKVQAALGSGLKVVLCIGEDWATHKKGGQTAKNRLRNQLSACLGRAGQRQLKNLIVVYEPIWAISSRSRGRSDKPAHAAEMIKYLRELLRGKYSLRQPKVLYGGSVRSKNVADFLRFKEIDGFLVGAASLEQAEIRKILAACNLAEK